MFQTKVTFTKNQTPEQRKAHAAYWRKRDRHFRLFNTALEFWRVCGKPVCRREQSCTHDMHACFERNWAPIPEEDKEYWRGCITAARHTRVAEEIDRAGVAARDAYLKSKERIDALFAAHAPAPAAARPEPEVRIRRL